MSVALRHPEESTDSNVSTQTLDATQREESRQVILPHENDLRATQSPSLEWSEVSAHIHSFTGATPEDERIERQAKRRAHRRFFLSSSFVASALVFAQLLGLIYLYALELQTLRTEARIERRIAGTQLEISLAQSQLATTKTSAELEAWAAQLGYRKAQITEMDDITLRSGFVQPAPQNAERGAAAGRGGAR